MNKTILNIEVQNFISKNLTANISSLLLKGSPFEHVSVQELANQIIAKKKAEKKLPTWFLSKNIYYPNKLSIEQTSSEITATYKSNLLTGNSIIDITGGFGIDAFYFAKYFKKVIHCEIDTTLSEIVAHNYKQLQVNNIKTIASDGLIFLKNTDITFDCIYVDPSRRNEHKGKVFLLKDCLPNIPDNLDLLFAKSTSILIKNSPILDITSAIHELQYVKEVHIIAVKNEVKELLFLLEKGYTNDILIKTINLQKEKTSIFNFTYQSKAVSTYTHPLQYLYEPNAAILKAGGFHHVSEQFNICKLHQHSHLYTSNTLIDDFPGRSFKIKDCFSYDKKQIKQKVTERKANITTRNFPKTVAQIRKETKLIDGGGCYLFFTKGYDNKNIVILCEKTA